MVELRKSSPIALIALLVLSCTLLSLHVATHLPVDQANCEFCAGHSSTVAGDSSVASAWPAPATVWLADGTDLFVPPQHAVTPHQQRAPPIPA